MYAHTKPMNKDKYIRFLFHSSYVSRALSFNLNNTRRITLRYKYDITNCEEIVNVRVFVLCMYELVCMCVLCVSEQSDWTMEIRQMMQIAEIDRLMDR